MPKIVDHEQRRTEITRGLWDVISDRGIEGVTYGAVAQATGVSVGRVQHYFTSKENLIHAGCQAIVDRASRLYTERVRGLNPWQALLDLLTEPIPHTESFKRGSAVWYAYLARGVVDPAIGAIIVEASRGTVDEAASLLRTAGAPPAEAVRLVSLSNGLTQRVLVGAMTADEAIPVLRNEITCLQRISDGGASQTPVAHCPKLPPGPPESASAPGWTSDIVAGQRHQPPPAERPR
ncbi:TetR family transcriptional regulator [Microbacterium sp. Gd 4-13]|uniref:TetR/AcrR family transcriptional regulator n=1 Tax=Microbacterium sp. Gd 4-13 TaxID=2173179 RepID=UPI000D57CA0D|nr:TetR/AcrR family transcriptional regulator [Microbacterium sp. Gd 4-13]PVW01893.1 TetR family transcriptional regulator [Microbacterium sp. Gd 4-13]